MENRDKGGRDARQEMTRTSVEGGNGQPSIEEGENTRPKSSTSRCHV